MADCGTTAGFRAGCRCEECRTAINAYQRRYQREYIKRPHARAKRAVRRAWKDFGMTVEACERMWAMPCMACGATTRSVIDHDHNTGKVRGSLCAPCNRALGFLGDDPIRVAALAAYIREWTGRFGRFAPVV